MATIVKYLNPPYDQDVVKRDIADIEEVKGFAPCLTDRELKLLDGFEGYPGWYRREKVQIEVIKEGKVVGTKEALAYATNDNSEYHGVSDEYLIANEKTREAFHKLSGTKREDDGWLVRRARDLSVDRKWFRSMW